MRMTPQATPSPYLTQPSATLWRRPCTTGKITPKHTDSLTDASAIILFAQIQYMYCTCVCVCVCACRYLEEYLDSKRPLSPLSPLSDGPQSTKPLPKGKTSEQHHAHVHKSRDKNRDSALKVRQRSTRWDHPDFIPRSPPFVLEFISPFYFLPLPTTQPKMEVECVKVSRQHQPPSESWGLAGHRGAVPNNETWATPFHVCLTRTDVCCDVLVDNGIATARHSLFCISVHLSPHHAEYYLHEAKRMKHRADAMVSRWS